MSNELIEGDERSPGVMLQNVAIRRNAGLPKHACRAGR